MDTLKNLSNLIMKEIVGTNIFKKLVFKLKIIYYEKNNFWDKMIHY